MTIFTASDPRTGRPWRRPHRRVDGCGYHITLKVGATVHAAFVQAVDEEAARAWAAKVAPEAEVLTVDRTEQFPVHPGLYPEETVVWEEAR